jgi:hypothetical protein
MVRQVSPWNLWDTFVNCLTYVGLPVPAEKEAAAVRANFPMPRLCGIYYYEVEIINKGLKGLA